jgi:hypothetical protein
MLFGNAPLLNSITQKMAWLSAKSVVHSQNIALGDTPNYQPQEIKGFTEILSSKGKLNLGPDSIRLAKESTTKEWEVMMQAEAAAQHQAMVGTYKKYMTMLKTIMGAHG